MYGPRFICVVTVALLIALIGGDVLAQKQPTPDEVARAKEHYLAAERHYTLGEFDEAVREYRAAYDLTERPALLFNIAQAYRLKGDNKQALHFYKTYLRVAAQIPNIDYVQEQIRAMESDLADQQRLEQERLRVEREQAAAHRAEEERKAAEEQRKAAEAERLTAAASTQPVDEPGNSEGLRLAGYITGGAGLAMLGASAGFALKARSGWDDVNQLAADRGTWTNADQDTYKTAESDETLAAVFAIVGGAAAVTGGVLWFLGREPGDAERDVGAAVVPTRGGASMVMTWTY